MYYICPTHIAQKIKERGRAEDYELSLCQLFEGELPAMADILEHPDKDNLTDEKEFKFAEGSVLLKTADGKPLDLKMSIWLLESVRHYIMKLSFED